MELLKEIYKYAKDKRKNVILIVLLVIYIIVSSYMIIQYLYTINGIKLSIEGVSYQVDKLQDTVDKGEDKIAEIIIENHDIDQPDYSMYIKDHMKIPDDHIRIGINIMESNNIDPILLFAIIDARTGGNLFEYTSSPTVRGYGLMIENTSRWVYEDMLGKRNYSNDMQNDGSISIQILAEYISYLMKVHNGDIREVTYSYIGSVNDYFYNEIKEYIECFDKNVVLIEYEYINKKEGIINE